MSSMELCVVVVVVSSSVSLDLSSILLNALVFLFSLALSLKFFQFIDTSTQCIELKYEFVFC